MTVSATVGRRLSRLTVALATILLVGACEPVAVAPASPSAQTAVEACRPPATAEKAGQTIVFRWQASVELDLPDSVVLFLTSGLDDMTCEAIRAPGGGFAFSTSGLGRLDRADPTAFTYDTGFGPTSAAPRTIVAGRAPANASDVEARAADGTSAVAALRSGLYIVQLNSSAPVTEIVAHDARGTRIARLADPSGLRPPLVTNDGALGN